MLHFQNENRGLRNSVISGVSFIINQSGSVIVVEDDLVLSPYFLTYMNEALNKYEKVNTVGQISGFSFLLDAESVAEDSYFLPLSTTWGWATWKRVWEEIDFEGNNASDLLSNQTAIKAFNLNNSFDYYSMLQKQLNADAGISSWGIMFWLNTFSKKFLVLYPKTTLTLNTGFDGSGRHKANEQNIEDTINDSFEVLSFPKEIEPNGKMFELLQTKLYKQEYSFKKRLLRLIKKIKG
jgi:hypothetical protein